MSTILVAMFLLWFAVVQFIQCHSLDRLHAKLDALLAALAKGGDDADGH